MKLKWNFKTCQKETKVIAGTIWKVVGPGDKDVRTSRGSLRRFQKRDSFPKRRWGSLRPAPGKEGESAFHLRMKLKVARAWFRRFPAFSGRSRAPGASAPVA